MTRDKKGGILMKKTLAKEWLILIGCFIFGGLILPATLLGIIEGNLNNLVDTLVDMSWLFAIFLYILVQFIRSIIWSIKQLKKK